MEKKTVKYKRTLRGSIGAGMNALFNGAGRRYYILEHRDTSAYYKAGESQKIIIDQLELGRSSKCQVCFGDTFPTVSRRHAAIVREGDGWKLVQLSETNSTFLNGRPIEKEWYLENGDEIQLSIGGPRLGFIVPAGNQSLVSSIRLTERLTLFRKQALRPYKRAIAALALLLVLLSSVGGYFLYEEHQRNLALEEVQKQIQADNDSLHKHLTVATDELAQNRTTINGLKSQVKNLKRQIGRRPKPTPPVRVDEYSNDVFYVTLLGYKITLPSGETGFIEVGDTFADCKVNGSTGSGFLLNNGTFVTARHVVEPWLFGDEELSLYLNMNASNGGKVEAVLAAAAPSGAVFELYTSQFSINRSHDKMLESEGLKLRDASNDYTDYATCHPGRNGKLAFDKSLSCDLKAGEKLMILGYPLGLGATRAGVKPSYSSAEVARDGLAEGGYIMTTVTGFEHGNSGGPVFAERNGKKIVVGIVSAGAGRSTGFVVPISVIN